MRSIRNTSRIAGVCLAVMAVVLLNVAPASASLLPDQVCLEYTVVQYNPPVTNTPQTVHATINTQYFACTSSSANTGTSTDSFDLQGATCNTVLRPSPGMKIINWTNPAIADSVFTFNSLVNRVNGITQNTFLGQISSGSFTPDAAREVVTAPDLDVTACAGAGESQQVFLGTLVIGGLL